MKRKYSVWIVIGFYVAFFAACDDGVQLMKNVPVGNSELNITGFGNHGVLREDTLTIYGKGFNPITYQNAVLFPISSTQTLWIDETGTVTDSIVYTVSDYSLPALVVDASFDSLKVIIPKNAVYGPIAVSYGVDTARSAYPYDLLTTELRPKIRSFVPVFSPPGVSLKIEVGDGSTEIERMVVSFGNVKMPPDNIIGSGIQVLYIKIPNIAPGPKDLKVGKKIESGDTLWSQSVNFGVLPSKQAPFMTVTYDGGTGGVVAGVVGYGEIVDGVNTNLEGMDAGSTLEISRGIAYNSVKDEMYWVASDGSAGYLVLADIPSKNPVVNTTAIQEGFQDVVFIAQNGTQYLYLSGNQIRRLRIKDNLEISSSSKIFPSGSPSSSTTRITNLKITKDNFYWVDNQAKIVVKAKLNSADSLSFSEIDTLYKTSSGLTTPFGIAVNEETGNLFITMRGGGKSQLMRGSVDGATPLQQLLEYETSDGELRDIEIDLVSNHLYFALYSIDPSLSGILRVPLSNPSVTPESIYQFPRPNFFDIKIE